MTASHVLAIDAGTSGVRCLIVDLNGRVVSFCRREWSYQSPDRIGPLGKEFSPELFWNIICDSVREALNSGGINPGTIVGVSATSQREGAVFLDKEGKELYAGPNIDLRALIEGASIDNDFGDEVYLITGHLPSFLFIPAKLKWFRENSPELYSKITRILSIADWIIYRLSGEQVSEVCGACELGLVDISSRQWSDRLIDLLSLPGDIYPELVPAGSLVGKVTHKAADETGIPEGTVVAQGSVDTHCGLVAMDVMEVSQVGIVLGWSAPVQMVINEPVCDPENRIWTGCHVEPGKWILESNAGEAGNAYRWLKEIMFSQHNYQDEAYDIMDRMALESPLGADSMLAFVGPDSMNMNHLTLRFGGFFFPLPLSVSKIQDSHLVRASLENICFAIKANSLQLEMVSSTKMNGVRVGGGLSRSRCLGQILTNVLDMPVCISEMSDVSGLGAAMCAAAGCGAYASLKEASQVMMPGFKIIEPDPRTALEYAEYYQRWVSAVECLEKLSEVMN